MQNSRALLPPRATCNFCNQCFSYCLSTFLNHKTRTNIHISVFITEGEQNAPVSPHKGPAIAFQLSAQAIEHSWLCSPPRPGAQLPRSKSGGAQCSLGPLQPSRAADTAAHSASSSHSPLTKRHQWFSPLSSLFQRYKSPMPFIYEMKFLTNTQNVAGLSLSCPMGGKQPI